MALLPSSGMAQDAASAQAETPTFAIRLGSGLGVDSSAEPHLDLHVEAEYWVVPELAVSLRGAVDGGADLGRYEAEVGALYSLAASEHVNWVAGASVGFARIEDPETVYEICWFCSETSPDFSDHYSPMAAISAGPIFNVGNFSASVLARAQIDDEAFIASVNASLGVTF